LISGITKKVIFFSFLFINFLQPSKSAEFVKINKNINNQNLNKKIKFLTKDLNIPWFAIGGVKSNNIPYLKRNGLKKIALVSQLMNSEDPKEDAIMILKELSHEN